jgi:hypothetical protein
VHPIQGRPGAGFELKLDCRCLRNDIGADNQKYAKHYEQDESDYQVFGGGFVVLIRIHVLVPLKVFIKYYSVPKLKPNYHRV